MTLDEFFEGHTQSRLLFEELRVAPGAIVQRGSAAASFREIHTTSIDEWTRPRLKGSRSQRSP